MSSSLRRLQREPQTISFIIYFSFFAIFHQPWECLLTLASKRERRPPNRHHSNRWFFSIFQIWRVRFEVRIKTEKSPQHLGAIYGKQFSFLLYVYGYPQFASFFYVLHNPVSFQLQFSVSFFFLWLPPTYLLALYHMLATLELVPPLKKWPTIFFVPSCFHSILGFVSFLFFYFLFHCSHLALGFLVFYVVECWYGFINYLAECCFLHLISSLFIWVLNIYFVFSYGFVLFMLVKEKKKKISKQQELRFKSWTSHLNPAPDGPGSETSEDTAKQRRSTWRICPVPVLERSAIL